MKRLLDITAAIGLLAVLSPILTAVAIALRLKMGTPVVFTQLRPGLGGQPFRLFKFRTMTIDLGEDQELLPDDDRLTPFGEALRRWSIDETLELWNVVKGDMSLVGPRPLLTEYLDLYTKDEMRRHDVRPGITGLAQVRGRNDQSWQDRLDLDLWYVDNWSLTLDAKILAATVPVILARRGISAAGHATMPRFEGTNRG